MPCVDWLCCIANWLQCRRGYDVFAFAAAGATSAVGLDICLVATAAAKEQQQQTLADFPAAAAAVHLCTDDFFTFGSSSSSPPFDIGYDYTFLCALHPGEQRSWYLWTQTNLGQRNCLCQHAGPGPCHQLQESYSHEDHETAEVVFHREQGHLLQTCHGTS